MAKSIANAMNCLNALLAEIFACLLEPAYPNQLYYFERRLHKQKNKCFDSINSIKVADARSRCMYLFEVILDIAQLRRRVTDHTTFGIVTSELSDILLALNASFLQIQQKLLNKQDGSSSEDHVLSRAIDSFEGMYFSVVNVAAREPLVFLLFIDGLKTVSELLADCDVALEEWR
ncbi:MAG: hypothetical protein WAW86_06175 [Gammaproteobacteria bacterium]